MLPNRAGDHCHPDECGPQMHTKHRAGPRRGRYSGVFVLATAGTKVAHREPWRWQTAETGYVRDCHVTWEGPV